LPVGGSKSLMPAAAALNGIGNLGSGTFPGSGAVAGSLNAGATDCGGEPDAPFALARAAGAHMKIVSANTLVWP